MKRFLSILVVLSLALAQGTLPKEARFDQPVVQTGTQVPLPVLLEAMAKAVGLSPVLRDIPNVNVNADFNQKPFRQVWDLLIKTYGDGKLDYVLLDNNVILVGAPDVVQRAKGQPETVQAAPAEPTVRQFYQVRSADPAQLAAFVSSEISGVSVKQVPGQSTLIITGTAKQQADVAALLERADPVKEAVQAPTPTPIEPTTREFYQIRSSEPGQLIQFIQQEVLGVTVRQLPGQNALLITGTSKQQAEVAALLQRVDPVKVVETPTPAASNEPIIREFYQIRSSDPAQLVAFIPSEILGVSVKQVPGQSILIITGTAKQQADVSALLQRVDPPKVAVATVPILQKSFSLSHAKAEALAKVISDTLNTAPTQDQGQPAAQGQAQASAATPKATVAAEPRTNTLIVTGTADQIAQVERLIPQLDRPIQQVQLQIRVQSVNSEVFRNIGVKWETLSGGNLIASILNATGQGLNLIFDATRSLTSLNIRAVLDALEGQSLSRRLSDANVLVLDNYGTASDDIRGTGSKGAEVKVGGRLLIPIKVGDQVSVREFDYGLIVRVRPQITNDGNIVLEVYTQTGDDPADGPAGSIRVPQQSTLSSLRIRDGQTVVIGGLIQQTSAETINQVPILGSIPLLGELFKTRSNSTKSDELIVIITGNIVKDAAVK